MTCASVPKLRELLAEIDAPADRVWDVGTIQLGKAPLHVTYLVGYPRAAAIGGGALERYGGKSDSPGAGM